MEYRMIKNNEIEDSLKLVERVFMIFEAPLYKEEGVKNFLKFIELNSFKDRMIEDNIFLYGCFDDDKIIGVIAYKNLSHITLLFVDENYHRMGIATNLFNYCLNLSKENDIDKITVNSSPTGINYYHAMGFNDTSEEQEVDGIIFTPMQKILK